MKLKYIHVYYSGRHRFNVMHFWYCTCKAHSDFFSIRALKPPREKRLFFKHLYLSMRRLQNSSGSCLTAFILYMFVGGILLPNLCARF